MIDMIECGTCGYPLLPEERRSLVESNGKMVKPWVGLTDEEIGTLTVFEGLHHVETPLLAGLIRVIEAKLKEKNA